MSRLMGYVQRAALVLAVIGVLFTLPTTAFADEPGSDDPPTSTTTTTVAPEPPPADASNEDAAEEPAEDTGPPPSTAPAQRRTFVPVRRYNVLKKLVFPVVGTTKYWAGFGDCRDNCTREHHGIDILTYGFKGLPVVAAHDGTVVKVTYDEGNPGCSVRIRGRDGWETRYYHLNTDAVGTDDPGHACPAPGIEVGTSVVAGQIIGYVGDSGNSEHTVPHLHFELRNRSGYPIDPYRSLRAAEQVIVEWLPTDVQDASIALSQATHPEHARVIVVVAADEVAHMGARESDPTTLMAPLVVIDPEDPEPAVEEIRRLGPERIIGLTDGDGSWLRDRLFTLAPIVAIDPITNDVDRAVQIPYDLEVARNEDVPDRFATIVAGVVDKIWRSRLPTYEAFIDNHRSIVLITDRYAPRRIGVGSWTYPGKYADKNALWWITGDGWIPTPLDADPPDVGTAYVTEKLAKVGTLGFLGSLAELPPMPVWRSS